MKNNHWGIIFVSTLAIVLNGCMSGVNLNDIDTRAELPLKIALPIGSMSATIGDFLGDSQVPNLFIGSDQVLYFCDTAHITRQYHDVDLASKISSTQKACDVHKVVGKDKIYGIGTTIQLPPFRFVMHLDGINNPDSVNFERLDSARIKSAKFTSNIDTMNFNFDPSYIKKVEIVLGEEFRRGADGKDSILTVFEGDNFQYKKDIDIYIDQFVIDLVDHKRSTANKIVTKDSCVFHIKFYVNVPLGTPIDVPNNASFQYKMDVQFINYDAIWGYFNPSNQMHDEDTIDLFKELGFWQELKKAKLPFSDPVIDLHITTQVAGCMRMFGDYLFTQSQDETTPHYATFDQAMTVHDKLYEWTNIGTQEAGVYQGGYMHPIYSAIGDSVCYHIQFDRDWKNGHIDNLFATRPDYLGYKFHMDFDQTITPQIRIVPNTFVRIDGVLNMPFKFNKGTELAYTFHINNIDLSKITLDSLLAETEVIDTVKTANLLLVLDIQNSIPLHVQGVCRFYDADSSLIMDPDDSTHPLRFGDSDTLTIEVPHIKYEQGISHVSEPGKSIFMLAIDRENFDLISKIKSMTIELLVDTEDLDYAYNQDPNYRVTITGEDKLAIQVGFVTDAKAVFDFTNKQ